MRGHFGTEPAGLLVGMMDEKDQDGFFRALAEWPHWAWVGVYRVESPRAMAAEGLAEIAGRHFHNIRTYKNLEQALELMTRESEKTHRVVATGSLYSIARLQEWGSHHGSGRRPSQRTAKAEQVTDHRNP
jgi:folylpolyglutamate synthase/dihydropteroate synthase